MSGVCGAFYGWNGKFEHAKMHVGPFAGLRDCSDRVFGHFFQILSSRCLQRLIAEIRFIFSSINMFCVPLRAHFNPGLAARATMTLSRAQNIGVPKKINTIVWLTVFYVSPSFAFSTEKVTKWGYFSQKNKKRIWPLLELK